MKEDIKASNWIIVGNAFLFIIKIIVGIMFNTISLISDALNSFTDILASIVIKIALKVSHQKPDKEHQFGHTRAQPIGGLVVAFFTIIVGYEVITNSINRIITKEQLITGIIPLIIVGIVFITKMILYIYTKSVLKKINSIALKASLVDHKNDIMISISVFIGLFVANMGYPIADPIIAIFIGLYIIKAGWNIGAENIDYLMGKAPPEEIFEKVEKTALSVKGVLGLNDVRAHFLGSHTEVEIHIYVDKNMNIQEAHDIGKLVQNSVEDLEEICKAIIHIDPFKGKLEKKRKFG